MNIHTPGRIYLSDTRNITETKDLRRYSSLHRPEKQEDDPAAVQKIFLMNDELLAGACKSDISVEKNAYLIIIPITGELNWKTAQEHESTVDVEEVQILFLVAGSSVTISNPYAREIINYLLIGIYADPSAEHTTQKSGFGIAAKNQLIELLNQSATPFKISIGCFTGRSEALYCPRFPQSLCFAFVIAGAFEMQGRLLHERDGLALWDTNAVELEALSNDAIILLIEL
jgi:hypothetical protein